MNCTPIPHILSVLTCISGMSGIIYLMATLSALVLPDIPYYIHTFMESEHPYTIYVCTRYECAVDSVTNPFIQRFTWGQLLAYTLFHLFTALAVPILAKQAADNIALNITQRVTETVRHLRTMTLHDQHGGGFFPPHPSRYDSEDDSDNDNEYIPQTYQWHFPHHMSAHIPPSEARPALRHEPFGQLVSRQIQVAQRPSDSRLDHRPSDSRLDHRPSDSRLDHRPRHRISYTVILHMINIMRLSSSLFTNTDNGTIPDADYTPIATGIPTHIDPARVRTAVKTFAGDACPICIGKFHLLEINSKSLAVTEPCNHLFCHACIDEYVNDHANAQAPCPLCRTIVDELYISK
jgi:hypothetical protein